MNLIVIIISSLLAYSLAHKTFSKDGSSFTRHNAFHKNTFIFSLLIPLALCGLILRFLSLNYNYAHRLPLYPQAYAVELFIFGLNSLLVFSSSLLLFITFRAKRDRLSTCLATAFIFLTINSIYLYNTRSPIIKDRKLEGVTLQSDPMSCAAASLSSVATIFQRPLSEKICSQAIGTSIQGSSPAQIVLGSRRLGFKAQIIHQRAIKDLNFPSMLFVDAPLGKEKHALVIVSRLDNLFEIWDPDKGKVWWSEEYLESRWHGNGIEFKKN